MVTVACEDIELAGDIIQDMCAYNNIIELASTATFPAEMERFKGILQKIECKQQSHKRSLAHIFPLT